MKHFILVVLLVFAPGCNGGEFTNFSQTPLDAADSAPGTGGSVSTGGAPGTGGAIVVATGGAPEVDAGSGGVAPTGGAPGTSGGAPESGVPEPRCCIDSDCPSDVPFCSPWGTCYQGGDPYNCDYDVFCESFCVHCSGGVAGACEEKRCVCF